MDKVYGVLGSLWVIGTHCGEVEMFRIQTSNHKIEVALGYEGDS